MDNIETIYNKNMVIAERVCFKFEADLLSSVLMILGFGCRGQPWNVSPYENGFYRNRWFHIRSSPLQISTNVSRLLVFMDNIEMLHHKTCVVAEAVGFRCKADLFKSVPTHLGLGVHGQHDKMVAAKTVGFRFEADLFQNSTNFHSFFVVIDNIEALRHQRMLVVENVVFRFDADLFK